MGESGWPFLAVWRQHQPPTKNQQIQGWIDDQRSIKESRFSSLPRIPQPFKFICEIIGLGLRVGRGETLKSSAVFRWSFFCVRSTVPWWTRIYVILNFMTRRGGPQKAVIVGKCNSTYRGWHNPSYPSIRQFIIDIYSILSAHLSRPARGPPCRYDASISHSMKMKVDDFRGWSCWPGAKLPILMGQTW